MHLKKPNYISLFIVRTGSNDEEENEKYQKRRSVIVFQLNYIVRFIHRFFSGVLRETLLDEYFMIARIFEKCFLDCISRHGLIDESRAKYLFLYAKLTKFIFDFNAKLYRLHLNL